MTNKLLATLAAVLFTACLDEAAPIETEARPDSEAELDKQLDDRLDRKDGSFDGEASAKDGMRERGWDVQQAEVADQPACDRVIDSDGPCSVACNPDAVMGYVPEGTCAMFSCTLDDGNQFTTGGCNF